MQKNVEKMFLFFKENSSNGTSVMDVIDKIKADEELIEASNSYCVQCGKCDKRFCSNKEIREDGMTYCLLHDNSGKTYPYEKKIPEIDDIYYKLDPEKFAKPKVCHTIGPHSLGFLSIVRSTGDSLCPGAEKMFRDYQMFLRQQPKLSKNYQLSTV